MIDVVDERELQRTLDFAEMLLYHPGRAWPEFSLPQQRRFQALMFPDGVAVDRSGTPVKPVLSPVFDYLRDLGSPESIR